MSESVNSAEVGVRVFLYTSSQSIQKVSQIFFVISVCILSVNFFFSYILEWSIGGSLEGVHGPVHKVVRGPGQ